MNGDVIRLIALDEILGLFFVGMMGVALEFNVGNHFLHDRPSNSTSFRVPLDVIATFERL